MLLGFAVWFVTAVIGALRAKASLRATAFARLGVAMALILLASSLVDYPLRTPLLGALFALACGWMADRAVAKAAPAAREPTGAKGLYPPANPV